jgi:hypothetical protein
MSDRRNKFAQGIKSFVENPFTNLAKGVALLLIGLSDASETFRDDVTHGHVRIGHGLIIIGLFSILGVLPNLIESLAATERFLDHRQKNDQARKGAGNS